ncbi:MAG: S-methyl-5-thioribose-1-phosphate isomerase [Candidatus Coatesbacteria bacterium]|nr:MAG: S-methyl-5-thioribose-1-phosphate isomerase [Candidatus Coatesbacteria bacterium]
MPVETLRWTDGGLELIDQTKLPGELTYLTCRTPEDVHDALRRLVVRGAPAIGVASAYGLLLGLKDKRELPKADFAAALGETAEYLKTARPTAVNLFWAIDRMLAAAEAAGELEAPGLYAVLESEADAICEEDRESCRLLGRFGAELLKDGDTVLTHCNAGALATVDYGTALGVVYAAVESGKQISVYADETRPLLQGARLTAWELGESGVPVTLICDDMVATSMAQGRIDAVVVGADRIAANGDTANKIGTLGVAILAQYYLVPFYIAAPLSTVDFGAATGESIPIEERSPDEVRGFGGQATAPDGVDVYNPAFDVTPAHMINAIITDRGVARPPLEESLAALGKEDG